MTIYYVHSHIVYNGVKCAFYTESFTNKKDMNEYVKHLEHYTIQTVER